MTKHPDRHTNEAARVPGGALCFNVTSGMTEVPAVVTSVCVTCLLSQSCKGRDGTASLLPPLPSTVPTASRERPVVAEDSEIADSDRHRNASSRVLKRAQSALTIHAGLAWEVQLAEKALLASRLSGASGDVAGPQLKSAAEGWAPVPSLLALPR